MNHFDCMVNYCILSFDCLKIENIILCHQYFLKIMSFISKYSWNANCVRASPKIHYDIFNIFIIYKGR